MAAKKPAGNDKLSGIEKAKAMINERYGANTIVKASQMPVHQRMSSGIVSFDIAHGGGFAKGGLHLLSGNYSSGKTTIATRTIGTNQKVCRLCNTQIKPRETAYVCKKCWSYTLSDKECITCGSEDCGPVSEVPEEKLAELMAGDGMNVPETCTCGQSDPCRGFYIDNEGTFDPMWAVAHGVNIDALEVVRPEYAEQSIDIIEALIRTGEVDIIVWDSIAASTPGKEIEESTEDWQMGLHARLVNKACVSGDTLVLSENTGELIEVRDLQVGTQLLSTDGTKTYSNTVTGLHVTGRKPCLRINNSITVTADHRMLTDVGWVEAGKLTKAHRLARPRKAHFGDTRLPEAEMRLLGFMLADGCFSKGYGSGTFTKTDQAIVTELERVCTQLGGSLNKVTVKEYRLVKQQKGLRSVFRETLTKYGLTTETSRYKFIPKQMFSADRSSCKSFIEALWSCDGWIVPHASQVGYTTSSRQLS